MKILAGNFKGRPLKVPKGFDTRPPLEILRGVVFNVLWERTEGRRVLDLFAGCGSLGLEALSRGAAYCRFLEKRPGTIKILKQNIEALGCAELCECHQGSVMELLDQKPFIDETFDCIFVDPPFDLLMRGHFENLEEKLSSYLAPEGVLVSRYPAQGYVPPQTSKLELQKVKTQGNSQICFYGH